MAEILIMEQTNFETPILFLIFNRPDTTQEVFNRIREIRPAKLFVAADGPRVIRLGEAEICEQTRAIIKQIDWPCDLRTLFREHNLGCGMAVSSAINWFFEQVEYGVILEDDCLPDLSFFGYCEHLLLKYIYNDDIMLIGGNNFLNGKLQLENSYYFSQYPLIWGWASWRRAWSNYDFSMKELDSFSDKHLPNIFKTQRQRKHLLKSLRDVKQGVCNTWDYQWQYSILLNKGMAITPVKNLVVNIGFRNQSTHTFLKDSLKENNTLESIGSVLNHPIIEINYEADYVSYKNVISYSPVRLLRLIKENGIKVILRYLLRSK